MISGQQQKLVTITPPAIIVNNASFTCTAIDTKGFNWVTIVVMLGALDIALTTLKLQQSDTNGSFVDITGANFSTGTNTDGTASTLPSATDDNHFFAFQVDMRGKKRWLSLSATMGAGSAGGYLAAFAILSRAEQIPNSMANRGFTEEIHV